MIQVLIIAKMLLFKLEHASKNRFKLLTFLNTKDNIRVVDDTDTNINDMIDENTDVIIYYCLSGPTKWTHINCRELNKCTLPVHLFFEDFQYSNIVTELFNKHNFNSLIIPSDHHKAESLYKSLLIPVKKWGYFIDTSDFYDMNLAKEYDILLYGFLANKQVYPLRYRIYDCLCKITILSSNKAKQSLFTTQHNLSGIASKVAQCKPFKIKYIEHNGYDTTERLPQGKDLSILINKSKFAIVTSSTHNRFLKKYIEIPLSGGCLIGDVPEDYAEELKHNIIEINNNMTDIEIMNILLEVLQGNYDHLLNKPKLDTFARKMKNTHSFEAGYIKLCELMDE
jgi:hypothetical protein